MITGVNRALEHAGREFHIQVEDLGLEQATLEVRVYDKGAVLWRKKIPYADIVSQGLGRDQQEEALRTLMEKTLQTVGAAIVKGKIG